jgi:hypothetical protein
MFLLFMASVLDRGQRSEVRGPFHFPTDLPPGKEPLAQILQEAGWAPEPLDLE